MVDIGERFFVVDSMSGNLAKWVRILGCSVKYVTPELDDSSVLNMLEGGILITRDSELLRKAVRLGYEAHEVPQDLLDAIAVLSSRFGVRLKVDARRTRCPFCDTPLEILSRASIISELPKEVLRGHRRFLTCRNCGKVFWFGSHYWKMLRTLARAKRKLLLDQSKSSSPG
ncbi:MAG: Mut7-C RNAse domain-containing protein [Candidatus Korarchaeum sp.]